MTKQLFHFSFISLLVGSIFLPKEAFAHVVVKPSEVGISSFQTFTIGVPTEKKIATTGVRLEIPTGLKHVRPNAKPGWKVTVKKAADESVLEINWTGGNVPVDQRDDFVFSAQVPSMEGNLIWKAYQTYADGSVVSWNQEQDPNQKDFAISGPYSQTKIVDDLEKDQIVDDSLVGRVESPDELNAKTISVAALGISILALISSRRKK